MCAKLLSCPLCSQPAFITLDALRTGLISVATRPLACPVCNEVLLGVDKLTIHLFSHAINLSNNEKTNVDRNPIDESREYDTSRNWNVVDVPKAPVTPLRKIASAAENPNSKNTTTSTSSQTSPEQIIFVQSTQTEKPVEETEERTVVQFQPVWTENSEEEICLVGTSNASAGQTLTIAPMPAEVIEAKPPSPDRSRVLPQLKAIKALATKEKTERCDVCGFYFSDPNILTLHKQLVHMINEKDLNRKPEELLKNYPCHLCPKVFKMRGSLMVHMRVAHIGYNLGSLPKDGDPVPIPGENGYNCPTCGKNFKKV